MCTVDHFLKSFIGLFCLKSHMDHILKKKKLKIKLKIGGPLESRALDGYLTGLPLEPALVIMLSCSIILVAINLLLHKQHAYILFPATGNYIDVDIHDSYSKAQKCYYGNFNK